MAELWARIQARKASLLRDLDPKVMLNELLQNGILNDDEHERVKHAGVTRRDRAEALLDILKTKDELALRCFMGQLGRTGFYPHLAEEIRTADKEQVEKAIPTPRNCRVQSSTRNSLTVAWDPTDALPDASVEVAIFAHDDDQEPVRRQEVPGDQTVVRTAGLAAGTEYKARVRVVTGELRGPDVTLAAKTESTFSLIPWKGVLCAIIVAVFAALVTVWMSSIDRRFLYPKDILDAAVENRPRLFGRDEDIANLSMVLENKRMCLVSGLSGVGKTSMVKEFLYRKNNEYTAGIVWVTSHDQINFVFVDSLRTTEGRDPIEYDYRDKSFEWTAEYLRKKLLVRYSGRFLFVFDNVENSTHASDMLKIVPDKSSKDVASHVILLSRRELSLSSLEELPTMQLLPLSEEAAVQLHRSLNKSDVDLTQKNGEDWIQHDDDCLCDIKALISGLGYLPHAIIQYYKNAEALHIKHGISYTAFESYGLLSESILPVRLDLAGYGQDQNLIVDEIRKVEKVCPKSYELLAVLSFFDHHEPVPLYALGGRAMEWDHPTFKGKSYYELAACLKKHSLIQFDTTGRSGNITLNRVVTFSIMYTLDSMATEARFFWTALEMSVRSVERLRQLSITCAHSSNDSPECKGFTAVMRDEMFQLVLRQSAIVAYNAVNNALIGRFQRCYAEGRTTSRSENVLQSVSLVNPARNISSWPVNVTKHDDDVHYTWPIVPWGNDDV